MISLLHISCYCQPRLPRHTPLSSLPLRNIWSKLQASGRCGWWSVWHWRDNYLEYKPKTWKIRKFSFKCQDQVGGLYSIIGLLSWLKTFFFTPTLGLRTTAVITISSNSPSHSLSLKSNICKSFFGRPLKHLWRVSRPSRSRCWRWAAWAIKGWPDRTRRILAPHSDQTGTR